MFSLPKNLQLIEVNSPGSAAKSRLLQRNRVLIFEFQLENAAIRPVFVFFAVNKIDKSVNWVSKPEGSEELCFEGGLDEGRVLVSYIDHDEVILIRTEPDTEQLREIYLSETASL